MVDEKREKILSQLNLSFLALFWSIDGFSRKNMWRSWESENI